MAFFKALYFLSIIQSPVMGLDCPSIHEMPVKQECLQEYGSVSPFDSFKGLFRYTACIYNLIFNDI